MRDPFTYLLELRRRYISDRIWLLAGAIVVAGGALSINERPRPRPYAWWRFDCRRCDLCGGCSVFASRVGVADHNRSVRLVDLAGVVFEIGPRRSSDLIGTKIEMLVKINVNGFFHGTWGIRHTGQNGRYTYSTDIFP
jgi:hypothetical protein